MRFGSLSDRGYLLMAVCGSKFDPRILPSPPGVAIHVSPDLTRAAIHAVQRARTISYIERGILPPSAFRNPTAHLDDRDEYCIHLIIHRGNCVLGTIRCQLHRRNPTPSCPVPLFREVLRRNSLQSDYEQAVEDQLDMIHPGYVMHSEISAWLANPDLKQRSAIGLSTLLSVWALGSVFPGMPNVSVLRASNAAASTLEQFGGVRLKHNGADMIVEDPYFKGPVQWMATHSHRYQERIEPMISDLTQMLSEGGLHTHNGDGWEAMGLSSKPKKADYRPITS